MFNLSKSTSELTLKNKTDVQHKIICDWLRANDIKLSNINTKLNTLLREFGTMKSPEHDPSEGEGYE